MYFTPGVYFEQLDRNRLIASTLQTDITGFVGYASRGPLFQPVKLTSWRQFQSIFGQPVLGAYLADSIYGFFENGGAACYVIRIAKNARRARLHLITASEESDPVLEIWASHGTVYDPITDGPLMESGKPRRFDSPGAWGNSLTISLQAESLGNTEVRGHDDWVEKTLPVEGISGFEKGSIIRVSQSGNIKSPYFFVQGVDPIRRTISLDRPLFKSEFEEAVVNPIRIESVEFDLRIFLKNLMVEEHRGLSLSPDHRRYVVKHIQAASQLVDVAVLLEENDFLDPTFHPREAEQMALSGGRDGLSTIDKEDYLMGLAHLQSIDEVSLIAAPDLVPDVDPDPVEKFDPDDPPSRPLDCHSLTIQPNGFLKGIILSIDDAGEESPIAGVDVQILGQEKRMESGRDGRFNFTNLTVGLSTLRLEKSGFHTLETIAQVHRVETAEVKFFLEPITTPNALGIEDIFDVQMAMVQQGEAGHYRMALLDPPRSDYAFEDIQNWRARFDSSYAALYYPWLKTSQSQTVQNRDNLVRAIPPSGYMAGVMARTDLGSGVHHAPANQIVQGVKALTQEVDDAQQAVLNPMGINSIRVLPGRGIRIYGARTLSSDPAWRYVNVRRLMMAIEEAVEEASQWTVFEPNNLIKIWAFSRGLPIKWTGPTLNAQASEISIESLEIAHEKLELQLSPGALLDKAVGGVSALF